MFKAQFKGDPDMELYVQQIIPVPQRILRWR